MGFSLYYRTLEPVGVDRAEAIRTAAASLSRGRTWLSCEPVHFYPDQEDGRLSGGSKPNFNPHPDDRAAAAREGLPDGTARDLLDILCELSREYGVDWSISHDHDPGPIGFIRAGGCDPRVRDKVEALADVADLIGGMLDEFDEAGPYPDDGGDDPPRILPFRPTGG